MPAREAGGERPPALPRGRETRRGKDGDIHLFLVILNAGGERRGALAGNLRGLRVKPKRNSRKPLLPLRSLWK